MMFEDKYPLTAVAENILQKRYYQPGESSWEDIVGRVISAISKETGRNRELLYRMIKGRYFIPNSPTLVNAGKPKGGLSACYVVPFEDSIEDIYKTKYAFAVIAKAGGGCGTTLSNLRPKGSPVNGSTHGYAGGAVDFYDTICKDMEVMTQAGFREMAMMGVMSVYHPDIIYFINAKAQEGKMRTTNISVAIDSAFMEKVEKDEEYETHFNGKTYHRYKARDIFNMIVDGAWRNGEPGLLFIDRINENSPYKYTGQKIEATNPCLDKDTLLLDGDKITKISSSGNTFVSWKTGEKEVIKLNTNVGYSIILTPDHKVMLPDGTFEEAQNLLGKEIAWIVGNRESGRTVREYVLYGFLFGDGFVTGNKRGISVKLNREKESEVASLLESFGFIAENSGAYYITRGKLPFDTSAFEKRVFEREIPESIVFGNSDIVRSFLVGLFEANGGVSKSGQISLKSTNRKLVETVQVLLSSFGIKSWIVTNKSRTITWKNGEYVSRESYNLQIAPREAYKFKDKIGFLSSYKNSRIKRLEKDYDGRLIVTSIENLGVREVWDFNNERHWEVANGIPVHNCGEQALPPWGVCNLGSIDLSKFINDGDFDFGTFEIAIRLAIRFLDDLIDANYFPLPEISEWAKRNRPVGLGIMGLADYFLIKGIAYGSKESLEEVRAIMSFMRNIAEDESIRLGEERGIPEECQKLPTPRRNITVLSIAPTGTISLLAGCSSGIEPVFSEIILRNDKTGTYEIPHPYADKPHFRCAVKSKPETVEVTPEEHVLIQNEVQRFVDSSVSKTINMPNHATRKDVYNAFMLAWKLPYIKGLTIYRNGSRQIEVLKPKKINVNTCPVCGAVMIKYDGCEKCSECEYSVCSVG